MRYGLLAEDASQLRGVGLRVQPQRGAEVSEKMGFERSNGDPAIAGAIKRVTGRGTSEHALRPGEAVPPGIRERARRIGE